MLAASNWIRNKLAFEEFAFTIDLVEPRLKFKLIAVQVTASYMPIVICSLNRFLILKNRHSVSIKSMTVTIKLPCHTMQQFALFMTVSTLPILYK